MERTRAWRHEAAGYGGDGCTKKHIYNAVVSSDNDDDSFLVFRNGEEYCYKESGDSCGFQSASYIVTDIEDSQAPSNNYCYGYQRKVMAKPDQPFKVSKIMKSRRINFYTGELELLLLGLYDNRHGQRCLG